MENGELSCHGEDGSLATSVGLLKEKGSQETNGGRKARQTRETRNRATTNSYQLRGSSTHFTDEGSGVDDGSTSISQEGGDAVLASVPDSLNVDIEREVPHIISGGNRGVILGVHNSSIVENDAQLAVLGLGELDHLQKARGEWRIAEGGEKKKKKS